MNTMFREKLKMPKIAIVLFVVLYILIFLFAKVPFSVHLIILFVGVLLVFYRVDVKINTNGFQYSVMSIFKRTYQLSEISVIQIHDISALRDFGGWGFRYSFRYGWGLISDAPSIMRVCLNNGKEISFSVADKEALLNALSLLAIPIARIGDVSN
ncbi:hypothetical protein [Sphingobacterium thalpophilum]|uniref:Bacterial Pleckstrin homology domain-containing protein n=1 Tax=Sphingobacterium thalpophilum TaxID=259 RepID=A0A4U9V2B9_9SPHI|nr:hypothetical protein [Sphingobacterium thalpophilum]VTR39687.1 Uncharacterised protein [Sphingobacterium thalpophilum]